jgi:hypothetical protein
MSIAKHHAEWLLHLLTDGELMGPTGPERQPRVTVIGTTTDVGRLHAGEDGRGGSVVFAGRTPIEGRTRDSSDIPT